MEIQKMTWEPDSILKSGGGQQRSTDFFGYENIQLAMSCSGILGGGSGIACGGRPESGYVGLGGKSEGGGSRGSSGVGNMVGAEYSNRRPAFTGSFTRDELHKGQTSLDYSDSLFSNWDHRNPLLECMTTKPLSSNEVSDVGQFSPGSGVNSSMRQNLDDLVSKILEEDPSQSNRNADDAFNSGLDDRKPYMGLVAMDTSEFGANLRHIWSSEGKFTVPNQNNQLNNSAQPSADLLKSALDSSWEATRLVSGYPINHKASAPGYQTNDHASLSLQRPASDHFPEAGIRKGDGIDARSFGSLPVKPGSAEMGFALRCLEKSVPFTSSHYQFSDVPGPFEAWPKVCSSQGLPGNQRFPLNSYPHGIPSYPPTSNVAISPDHSETLLAEVKSTIQSLVGPNALQGNAAAKQYLTQCLAQSSASGGLADSAIEAQYKQLKFLYNGVNGGQNGLMAPLRNSIKKNLSDQNLAYSNNKMVAALTKGQNVSLNPASSKTIPGGLIPSQSTLNAMTAVKRESELASMPSQASCGNLFLNQNQQFSYVQPIGKRTGYLASNFVPCSSVPLQIQPEMSRGSEGVLNHLQQDIPVFPPEALYNHQQRSNGVQFDPSGMPKVTQPAHVSLRGIPPPWLGSQGQPPETSECNLRCDMHNIGRVTPVILRPADIFYNNVPPPVVFGLPQYLPDAKLQRCFDSSNGLLLCLEECFEQLRSLEKEEKEVENEVMQHSLGRCLAPVNPAAVLRLPHNPSRVNRLVVESLREHSKMTATLGKLKKILNQPLHANIYSVMETWMEGIRKVQARRKEEIVSCANRSNSGGSRAQEEKDILALTAAVEELLSQTRRARTCLWCAQQISLYSGIVSTNKGQADTSGRDGSIFYNVSDDWHPADTECFQKCI